MSPSSLAMVDEVCGPELEEALKFLLRVHIEELEQKEIWFVRPNAAPHDIMWKRYISAWRAVKNAVDG